MPKIHLLNSHKTLDYDGQTSLLTCLEQQGIFHEYQCRSGYCGACRTKLQSGQVSYPQPPLAFLNEQEILLCICQADSDLSLEL